MAASALLGAVGRAGSSVRPVRTGAPCDSSTCRCTLRFSGRGLARAGGEQAAGARMIAARRRCLMEWLTLRGASGVPLARVWGWGMADVRIGTSGYVYRHWRGAAFYPAGLRAADELAWYASRFRTLELNNPFYRVPTAATFVRWRDETPPDFVFAVKVNRVISHARRLRDASEPLAAFLAVAEH